MAMNHKPKYDIVGNFNVDADADIGFKEEISHAFEAYNAQGVNLITSMGDVISDPTTKTSFMDVVMESVVHSPLSTNPNVRNEPFYNNYGTRAYQLLDNSLRSVATESAMLGYAPIVSYNPFFLKKQWIDCIFKDVLMTEIPKTPLVEFGFERRYLKDQAGELYPLPEALYDRKIMRKLTDEATGLNISEEPIAIADLKNLNILKPTYIPGIVEGDPLGELTANLSICKVHMNDAAGTEHIIPVNICVDVTTHNFVKGGITYTVKDADGNATDEVLRDELIGKVDFDNGTVTVMSTTGKVTKVCLRGKTANRWNQRSLDVVRKNEKIEKVMPESGPRLNSAVTIEDAADALALQNIEMISDNINVMGSTLANIEDFEIHDFLGNSFDQQEAGRNNGILYNELAGVDNTMTVTSTFNTLPYDGFTVRITEWMKDAREYFERLIGDLKTKLRSQNVMIVAVGHPNLVRFLQDGINWVFSDDTEISGVKLSYNFGIYTSAQDRVHIVTTQRMQEEDGIWFIVIPMTQELITYKHFKYNVVIDRNYRNPVQTLVPNIMATQRTLTFEILPVQGRFYIDGRELNSPSTLKRVTDPVNP